MKSLILYLFVFFGLLSPTLAQSSDSEKEAVIQLSKTKWQWMADKEADKLAELFDDKSVFVHMGGTWGKDREVNIIRSGGIWYKKADIHEVSVEIIDNTAILLNRITLVAEVGSSFETVKELCSECQILEGFSTKGGIERDGILFVMEGEREVEVRQEVRKWLERVGLIQQATK